MDSHSAQHIAPASLTQVSADQAYREATQTLRQLPQQGRLGSETNGATEALLPGRSTGG